MRQPTNDERSIMERLLEGDFPGRDELHEQIDNCLVEPIDHNGSLKFLAETEVRAPVKSRIPTEGETEDEDGVTIHVLLHVVEGQVHELEVYKDDSSKLLKRLNPTRLRLFRPH